MRVPAIIVVTADRLEKEKIESNLNAVNLTEMKRMRENLTLNPDKYYFQTRPSTRHGIKHYPGLFVQARELSPLFSTDAHLHPVVRSLSLSSIPFFISPKYATLFGSASRSARRLRIRERSRGVETQRLDPPPPRKKVTKCYTGRRSGRR